MATTTVAEMANVSRQDIAHRRLARALERVRSAEREAEAALDEFEQAVREQRDVNGLEIIPELSPGFESMWQARRVRLLAEREAT